MKKVTFVTGKKGFTLVELMAAMAITSILIIVIVSLTNRGVDIWRTVFQDVRAMGQARTALDLMMQDLESMQVRGGNNFQWLDVERDSGLLNNKSMELGPKGAQASNAARLIFFTTATDRNPPMMSGEAQVYNSRMMTRRETIGDINCVGYKLVYRDQILDEDASDSYNMGFPVYALYRNLIPSNRTFDDLLGKTDLSQAYKRYEADEARPMNFLVENIVEMTLIFEVEYRERQESQNQNSTAWIEVQPVPIIATGKARSGTFRELEIFGNRINAESVGGRNTDMIYGTVKGVTINLSVVTDEGMVIVDQVRRNRRSAPKPEDFFRRYTRSYSQRIDLPKPN